MRMSDYFFNSSVDCDDEGCLIENGFKIARGICKYKANAISHAVSNHDRLTEENAKLRHELANLIYMAENNTGNEPSLSCFHLAIDEAKQQLLNQLKDQKND